MKFIDDLYNKKDSSKHFTQDIFFRIIGSLLSSFLFLNLLPTFMFIVYMKERHIFSYDLFSDGIFGMSVFFFYGMMIIIALAIFITSSIFFLIAWMVTKKCNCENTKKLRFCKYDYDEDKKFTKDGKYIKQEYPEKDYKYFFIFAIIVNVLMIITLLISQPIGHVIYLLILCTILMLHLAFLIFLKAKYTIYSLMFFFPMSILILFSDSSRTADIISFGLHSFNSSDKLVNIKDMNNNTLLEGRMLLLSPDNIFVLTRENNDTNRTKILRRDNIIIDIKN